MTNTRKIRNVITNVFICAFAFSCNNSDMAEQASDKNAARAPGDEVTLNLCVNVVHEEEADEGVKNGYSWILTGSPAGRLETLEVKILKEHLINLRQEADDAHNAQGCTGYITGLQLHVGLDNKNLQVLFMPMFLCRKDDTPDSFAIHNSATDLLAYSLENGFTPASEIQKESVINYQEHIFFKESSTITRTFNPSMSDTGDTRAVMVSFQAIMAVLNQNESDTLKIWNYAIKDNSLPANKQVRQTFLLGPQQLTPEHFTKYRENPESNKLFLVSAFTDAYADRGNLCPPNCLTARFRIAQSPDPDCQVKK